MYKTFGDWEYIWLISKCRGLSAKLETRHGKLYIKISDIRGVVLCIREVGKAEYYKEIPELYCVVTSEKDIADFYENFWGSR